MVGRRPAPVHVLDTTRTRVGAGSPVEGVPVTQAAADEKSATNPNGGTWNDIDLGHSIYTFGTALPADYDTTITTTLGIYATRNMTGIQDKSYYDNVEQDFVPNGATVTEVWDEIANSACNTCHNPLSAHGGSRQDVKLCVLCHSPQTLDANTHQTADFKVLVHKIHMGENLPSVQAGIPYKWGNTDFSEVVFPQDIRNCTTCHAPPATQNTTWYTNPSQAACGACHDNINWTTGEGHPAESARQRLRELPHPRQRRGVRRLGEGRARSPARVQAAQGPEGRDRLGHEHRPR